MPKKIILVAHLSVTEVKGRYRNARGAVERGQWHVIWLIAQGRSTSEIAEVTGYSTTWIRTIVHRYNEHGPDGLVDRRRNNQGAEPLLDAEQQRALQIALRGSAPGGGRWTCRK